MKPTTLMGVPIIDAVDLIAMHADETPCAHCGEIIRISKKDKLADVIWNPCDYGDNKTRGHVIKTLTMRQRYLRMKFKKQGFLCCDPMCYSRYKRYPKPV
jgi:hypothetical protein